MIGSSVWSELEGESSGLVGGEEAMGITMRNTSFSSCWRDNGDGGGLEVDIGRRCEFVMERCNLSECGVESEGNGKGGGILLRLSSTGIVNVSETRMDVCYVNEQGGRGGAMRLVIHSTSLNSFLFRNVNFTNNRAWIGRNIFVTARSLRESVTQERFDFVVGEGEDLFNGNDDDEFIGETGNKNIVDLWDY